MFRKHEDDAFRLSISCREFSSGLSDVLDSFGKLMEAIFYVKEHHNK